MEDPIQLSHLTTDATVSDLPAQSCTVDENITGQTVLEILMQDSEMPGVLIMHNGQLLGCISREVFFENTGRLFGTDVYLKRPIGIMLKNIEHDALIINADCPISLAVKKVLSRKHDLVYQPVIISHENNRFTLLNVLLLFMAQNQLLITLHNERLFTAESGLNISDEEAYFRYNKFMKNTDGMTTKTFLWKHTITCKKCGQDIEYSIADIVRSHPQLDKGIDIEERMGSRLHIFYVKHHCGSQIWEIPVMHDQNLEYRSQRTPRLAGTYV